MALVDDDAGGGHVVPRAVLAVPQGPPVAEAEQLTGTEAGHQRPKERLAKRERRSGLGVDDAQADDPLTDRAPTAAGEVAVVDQWRNHEERFDAEHGQDE